MWYQRYHEQKVLKSKVVILDCEVWYLDHSVLCNRNLSRLHSAYPDFPAVDPIRIGLDCVNALCTETISTQGN